MTSSEANQVAERINTAVHTLSEARMIIFKAVERFIMQEVSKNVAVVAKETDRKGNDPEDSDPLELESGVSSVPTPMMDLIYEHEHEEGCSSEMDACSSEMDTCSSEMDASSSNLKPDDTLDPLDLLLDKKHGKTLLEGRLQTWIDCCPTATKRTPQGRKYADRRLVVLAVSLVSTRTHGSGTNENRIL